MKLPILFSLLCISLFACKNKKEIANNEEVETQKQETEIIDQEHNAQTSLDWEGIYFNILPCGNENCGGIATMIQLNSDETYEYFAVHSDDENTSEKEEGTFAWDEKDKSIISLQKDINQAINYWVQENALLQIGNNKEKIDNELSRLYRLEKINPFARELIGKKWNLIELYGKKPVVETEKSPYIQFTAQQINGTGGCNGFFGTYTTNKGNRIRFGAMASTEMFCTMAHVDDELLRALEETDNWIISEEGELRLQTGKRAAHAIFQAN